MDLDEAVTVNSGLGQLTLLYYTILLDSSLLTGPAVNLRYVTYVCDLISSVYYSVVLIIHAVAKSHDMPSYHPLICRSCYNTCYKSSNCTVAYPVCHSSAY